MKTCTVCSESKPLHSYYRNKRMRDGHLNHCKSCFSEAAKTRYADSGESKRAYQRNYIAANKEKVAAAKKRYNEENAESIAERKAVYRQEHAAERREYFAKYRTENPEVIRVHSERRKVRMRGTFVLDVSDAARAAKLALFGGLCVYCGGDLATLGIHWDHWKPLSKGGLHMLSNLYPSCPTCNMSKNAKWPFKAPKNYSARVVAGEEVTL